MTCPYHEGEPKIMVCIECKQGVCVLCIENDHGKHQLWSIKTAAKMVIQKLEESVHNLCLSDLEKHVKDLSEIRQSEQESAKSTRQVLLDKQSKIQQLLKDTESMATTHDQHAEQLLNALQVMEQSAADNLEEVTRFLDEITRIKVLENPLETIEHGWQLKVPEMVKLDIPKLYRLTYLQGNRNKVEQLAGELISVNVGPPANNTSQVLGPDLSPDSSICTLDLFWDGPEGDIATESRPDRPAKLATILQPPPSSIKYDVSLTLKHSFNFKSGVRVIKPTREGRCWIRCYNDNHEFNLVDTNGASVQVIHFDKDVLDISMLPVTAEVLVSDYTDKCISVLVQGDSGHSCIAPTIHTDPLRPRYMCLTPNGDVIVTQTDKTTMSPEPHSTSVLVKYNTKGLEMARAHKDRHGNDLFYVPNKVCLSNTDTVVCINFTSSSTSHLVLLDNNLELTRRYIDHGVTVPADQHFPEGSPKFCVTDAVFNHSNLLLISEYFSKTVQLLDRKCNCLKTLVTDEQSGPFSLSFQTNGDLWVGLYDGKVNVYQVQSEFTSEEN